MTPTLDDVLDALRPGDTAAQIAERLDEPPGQKCAHSPARVLPLLAQAREQGIVVRETPGRAAIARWRFT